MIVRHTRITPLPTSTEIFYEIIIILCNPGHEAALRIAPIYPSVYLSPLPITHKRRAVESRKLRESLSMSYNS